MWPLLLPIPNGCEKLHAAKPYTGYCVIKAHSLEDQGNGLRHGMGGIFMVQLALVWFWWLVFGILGVPLFQGNIVGPEIWKCSTAAKCWWWLLVSIGVA